MKQNLGSDQTKAMESWRRTREDLSCLAGEERAGRIKAFYPSHFIFIGMETETGGWGVGVGGCDLFKTRSKCMETSGLEGSSVDVWVRFPGTR